MEFYFKKIYIAFPFLILSNMSVSGFFNFDNIKRAYHVSDSYSDVFLDSLQLLQKYNYPTEAHVVITNDGYKLNTFRIPGKGQPVVLVHGIGDTSDSWLVLGPKYSLAYQLSDSGYDVWIFNSRGNRYNKEHINNLPPDMYYNFSYEEIGSQDIPATIDYILSTTQQLNLTYIGFSQGTTAFFVMCSMVPEYNKKINHAILLAPVAWLQYTKYPLIKFWSDNLGNLMSFAKREGLYELFPFNENSNKIHAALCRVDSPLRILCELEYYTNFGLTSLTKLAPEKQPAITAHVPGGSSSKVFFHFIQGYRSQRFQRFDYGVTQNINVYSSPFPPEYDITNISIPLTLFSSEIDWFSDKDDVRKLVSKLKTIDKFVYLNESLQFTHLEFVYGSRVNSIINKPVLNILKELFKGYHS